MQIGQLTHLTSAKPHDAQRRESDINLAVGTLKPITSRGWDVDNPLVYYLFASTLHCLEMGLNLKLTRRTNLTAG